MTFVVAKKREERYSSLAHWEGIENKNESAMRVGRGQQKGWEIGKWEASHILTSQKKKTGLSVNLHMWEFPLRNTKYI
jgi:hypothetical protein